MLINVMIPGTAYGHVERMAGRLVSPARIVAMDTFSDQPQEAVSPRIEVVNLRGGLAALPLMPAGAFPVVFARPAWDYFIDSHAGHASTPNSPAHWFASAVSPAEYAEHLAGLRQDNFQTRWLLGTHGLSDPKIDMASLSHVVNVIEAADGLVIPQDRAQEGMILLAHRMGWPTDAFSDAAEIHPRPPRSRGEATLFQRIKDLNHLDQKLYAYAVTRLDRKIAESGLDLPRIFDRKRRQELAARVANGGAAPEGDRHEG